jgi:integral membrane protein (TIGR01906 family)
MTENRILYKILSWVVAIIVPLVLLMTSVRLLMNPLYPEIEYRLPGFPADPYGFSLTDRLKWSTISIDYLVNAEGIDYLGKQELSAGKPLYNERELSHMSDVKTLVQAAMKVWYGLLIGLALLLIWAWRGNWLREYTAGLARGGWITIGLIALIILATFINFDTLFTDFHHLFFTGDTWLFEYSDSLIRLFPIKFWEDGFIYMGAMSLIAGLALGIGFRKSLK